MTFSVMPSNDMQTQSNWIMADARLKRPAKPTSTQLAAARFNTKWRVELPGMIIVRMLERAGVQDHLIVVTRWYGGKHLGGDRFRHVQECVRVYLAQADAV